MRENLSSETPRPPQDRKGTAIQPASSLRLEPQNKTEPLPVSGKTRKPDQALPQPPARKRSASTGRIRMRASPLFHRAPKNGGSGRKSPVRKAELPARTEGAPQTHFPRRIFPTPRTASNRESAFQNKARRSDAASPSRPKQPFHARFPHTGSHPAKTSPADRAEEYKAERPEAKSKVQFFS